MITISHEKGAVKRFLPSRFNQNYRLVQIILLSVFIFKNAGRRLQRDIDYRVRV